MKAVETYRRDEADRIRKVQAVANAERPVPAPPKEVIQPLGMPMSQAEFESLDMVENMQAVKLIKAEDVQGLTALADEVREVWNAQHAKVATAKPGNRNRGRKAKESCMK